MSFYARPCEIHALNRICPHGDCVKVVREVDVAQLVAALQCARTLHIDTPGREGPDLGPLRAHGWNPSEETGPMFVARLARAALAKLGAK